jgi:hypothetical protein
MITINSGALEADLPTVLYRNVLAEGTLTAPGGTGSGHVANVLGPQTFDYWQAAAVGNRVQVVLAALATCDAFGIDAHDLGSTGASLSFAYRVASTGAWTTLATITPADDSPILFLFPPVAARSWSVEVAAAPGVMPSLGIVFCGPKLTIPNGLAVPYTPLNFSAMVETFPSVSIGAQLLATRFERRGKSASVDFNPVEGAWLASNIEPWREAYDTGATFFFAGCPSQWPLDVGYCRRASKAREMRPAYDAGGVTASLQIEVEAYGA